MVLVVLEFGHLALGIYIPQLKETIADRLSDPEVQQLVTVIMGTFSEGSLIVP